MATSSHVNLVSLIETYSQKRRLYIAMDLCTLGTLSSLLRRTPRLTEKVAAVIFHQLLQVGGAVRSVENRKDAQAASP